MTGAGTAVELYDRAACGLLRCGIDGSVQRSNLTLRHWLGHAPDYRFEWLHDVFAPASLLFFELQLVPLLALRRPIDGAFMLLRRADGGVLPIVLNAVHQPGELWIDMAMVAVGEREQYEATLRKAQSEAEQAMHAMAAGAYAQKMQAVGQMAAGIAHGFNNLLAVVRGNIELATTELLSPSPDGSGILQDLAEATAAAARMEGIVRQLLAFTGRQFVQVGDISLNKVVQSAAPLVQHALGPNTSWHTDLSEDLWPVRAASDQMEQLFTSIAMNASEAVAVSGRAGRITIATRNIHADASHAEDRVELTVSDTGIGMTDEVRRRAIDPFFSTKGLANRTGLGLSVAFGAVRAMRGELEISSTPGVGSRVVITLPRAAP